MPRQPRNRAQEAAQEDPYAGLTDEGHNEFAADLLEDAAKLQEEKVALLKKIDTNRQNLRLVAASGHVSPKQAKAVEILYPLRVVKKEGETDATTDAATTESTTPAAA